MHGTTYRTRSSANILVPDMTGNHQALVETKPQCVRAVLGAEGGTYTIQGRGSLC